MRIHCTYPHIHIHWLQITTAHTNTHTHVRARAHIHTFQPYCSLSKSFIQNHLLHVMPNISIESALNKSRFSNVYLLCFSYQYAHLSNVFIIGLDLFLFLINLCSFVYEQAVVCVCGFVCIETTYQSVLCVCVLVRICVCVCMFRVKYVYQLINITNTHKHWGTETNTKKPLEHTRTTKKRKDDG